MASITYDGQSFVLDGRRIWIVSGSINYARVPRCCWADRIHKAREAGLNCVETPVIWSRHEARPGQFDFTGENDIRHFVELVGKAGMYCILRPGPFVGQGCDLGGLPPWLLTTPNVRLRTNSQAFLEACSRYITALAGQVRDLQVVSPGSRRAAAAAAGGGPIVLIQNESGWTCGHDGLAAGYLGELDRYYREAGLAVPIVNANDLWQGVEGEIDGWTGYDGLLSHLRQLGWVRSDQPRLVMDLRLAVERAWGRAAEPARDGGDILARIMEVLAAGGQFNLSPFAGGTFDGFSAGRDPSRADAFLTTSADAGAPVGETGSRAASFRQVRRGCMFASRFARVLSHLELRSPQVSLLPQGAAGTGTSVIHCSGAQGGVAFLFAGAERGKSRAADPMLLLQDGSTLPVPMGDEPAAWCLLDTRLAGRSQLNYCNLSAFALVGRAFVCAGPEGARAHLSINGSPLEAPVPTGTARLPTVIEHEGIAVVVANYAQLDLVHLTDPPTGNGSGAPGGIYIGVTGFDADGRPIPHPDLKAYQFIDAEGNAATHKVHAANGPARPAKSARLALGEWSCAQQRNYADGSGPRFAAIEKPADLVSLGAPYGYGWYRFSMSANSPRKAKVIFPHSAHRLHLYMDGEAAGVAGIGPGATSAAALSLKKGRHTLVALAENLGRVAGGSDLGEQTGLYGHAWEAKEVRVGKPKIVASDPVNLLTFRAPLWRVQEDDVTDPARLTWTVPHRSKTPLVVHIPELEGPAATVSGLLMVNGRPFHYFQTGGAGAGGGMVFLDLPALNRGNNEIQIALSHATREHADELGAKVRIYDCIDCFTAKGEWAYARWERPGADAFELMRGGVPAGRGKSDGLPAWWKSSFSAPSPEEGAAPLGLLFDCAGLSKGQVFVNKHHIGRYWTATGAGKAVGPQTRLYIPPSALLGGSENEVCIFDEHGFGPGKCRVLHADGGVWDA